MLLLSSHGANDIVVSKRPLDWSFLFLGRGFCSCLYLSRLSSSAVSGCVPPEAFRVVVVVGHPLPLVPV